jgi:hypothetical protein
LGNFGLGNCKTGFSFKISQFAIPKCPKIKILPDVREEN